MAAVNYQSCLAFTLRFEGGNSDNQADPGGRTRKGITQGTYDHFRDIKGLARQDVFAMLDSEMETIYRDQYWNVVHGDMLRPGEDLCVFDFAVNSGPARAKSFWLMSGGAADAVEDVIDHICEHRLTFLRSLRTWGTFGAGWAKRVTACQATALKMADVLVMPAPAPQPVPRVPATPIQVPHGPVLVPPIPAAPAGLPPMSPSTAGRRAAFRDSLGAARDVLVAEKAAFNAEIDAEIAGIEKLAAEFGEPVAASAPPALQIPAADQAAQPAQKGISTVLGTNWQTNLSGIGALLGAAAGIVHSISVGQMPDMTQMGVIFAAVSAGIGLLQAKDKDVTGGTVPQTVEAQQRAKSSLIK